MKYIYLPNLLSMVDLTKCPIASCLEYDQNVYLCLPFITNTNIKMSRHGFRNSTIAD